MCVNYIGKYAASCGVKQVICGAMGWYQWRGGLAASECRFRAHMTANAGRWPQSARRYPFLTLLVAYAYLLPRGRTGCKAGGVSRFPVLVHAVDMWFHVRSGCVE